MILTQELWEEYASSVKNDITWDEVTNSNMMEQAFAAANATDWKLKKVMAAYEEERNNSINLHIENTKARKIIREFLSIHDKVHFDLSHIINVAEEFNIWGVTK